MMLKTGTHHNLIRPLSAGFIVSFTGAILSTIFIESSIWINFPVRPVLESVGFFTGFFLALLLFLQLKKEKIKPQWCLLETPGKAKKNDFHEHRNDTFTCQDGREQCIQVISNL